MKYWVVLLILASATLGFAQTPDPLGTASDSTITCPTGKIKGTACHDLSITGCKNTAKVHVYLKVIKPSGTSKGIAMFSAGGTVTGLYENFKYGDQSVNNVVDAGFTAVEVSFGGPFTKNQPNGWLVGSGGPRAAACNYATAVSWAYKNLAGNGADPVCLTGNSNGASLVGYALAHYGVDTKVAFAELTSGPPYGDMVSGCDRLKAKADAPCGEGRLGWGLGYDQILTFIDPSYGTTPGPICSETWQQKSHAWDTTLTHDSILSGDEKLSYKGYTQFVLGGGDESSAPNQTNSYFKAITSSKNLVCVPGAPHNLPDNLDGAIQVANDIIAYCK